MPGSKRDTRLLVLMAKQPRANHTKTRLSPPLSLEESADLYHCFLLDKLAQMPPPKRRDKMQPPEALQTTSRWALEQRDGS